jgi:hypothetical protein
MQFFLLWAIYSLGLFVLSVVSSVIRGHWLGVKLKYAFAVGLTAVLLHTLIEIYLKGVRQ